MKVVGKSETVLVKVVRKSAAKSCEVVGKNAEALMKSSKRVERRT